MREVLQLYWTVEHIVRQILRYQQQNSLNHIELTWFFYKVSVFSRATCEKYSVQLVWQCPQASISINGQDYWNTLIMNPQLALNFCKKP